MVKIPVPGPTVGAKPQGRTGGCWCLELTDHYTTQKSNVRAAVRITVKNAKVG